MLSVVPIFGCPLMGVVIDHFKNNAIFCFVGAALSTFGHVLLILGGQGIIPMVPVDDNCILDTCEMKTSFALLQIKRYTRNSFGI